MPSSLLANKALGFAASVSGHGGRTLTSYHTLKDDILNAGGFWEDREVVEDNNWVTSRQPSDIPAFNRP